MASEFTRNRVTSIPPKTLRELNLSAFKYFQSCTPRDRVKYYRFCEAAKLSRKKRQDHHLRARDVHHFFQVWLRWIVRNPHHFSDDVVADAQGLLKTPKHVASEVSWASLVCRVFYYGLVPQIVRSWLTWSYCSHDMYVLFPTQQVQIYVHFIHNNVLMVGWAFLVCPYVLERVFLTMAPSPPQHVR